MSPARRPLGWLFLVSSSYIALLRRYEYSVTPRASIDGLLKGTTIRSPKRCFRRSVSAAVSRLLKLLDDAAAAMVAAVAGASTDGVCGVV